MNPSQSQAEFVLGVYQAQLKDCACQYPELTKEFKRDFQRLSSALEQHGIMFALDAMPAFKKHFDKCLESRRLTVTRILHFGALGKGSVIPRLFRGLTLRVFEHNGELKAQPDINAIRWIRQLTGVVRKLRFESKIKDKGNAVQEFYQVDREVRSGDLNWDDHVTFAMEVQENATSFTDDVHSGESHCADLANDQNPPSKQDLLGLLRDCQRVADIITGNLGVFTPHAWRFKHGPGAVSDGVFGEYKYSFPTWSDRLESVFPYADFAVANYACVEEESLEDARVRGFLQEPSARLHAVPKTIKVPRLIASEPASHQWCQQAVRDFFYSRVTHTFISQFLTFRNQSVNGELAKEASLCQSHSTIDLSSASDRISCWHVERLFRRSPSLLQALQSCRTETIEQNICRYSPRLYKLRKYSTMGNATTFPVQSLFFLTLALASVLNTRKLKVTMRNIVDLGDREVRVFGDDIVIPTDCSDVLIGLLKTLSMRVNDSKTFTGGNFRESCGVDAFSGEDVTVTSILEIPSNTSPNSIISTVDAHNNMQSAGYFCTAAYIRKTAGFKGYKKIREVRHGDGAFGWLVFGPPVNDGFRHRVHTGYQRLEIQCLTAVAVLRRKSTEGYPGLLQFFTEAAKEVTSAVSTLHHLVRRPKVKLRLRWAAV